MSRPYSPSRPILLLICLTPVILLLLAMLLFVFVVPDSGVGHG
ncbi:hypothetical protein [Streptacidiphilus sp. PAMC 29251]